MIPFVGDFVDFGFKANRRNLQLFRHYARDPNAGTGENVAFFAGVLLVVLGAFWLAALAVGRVLDALVAVF